MKQAVMYGAGNIGRGFIGELFYQSGYRTGFIDVNSSLISMLNKEEEYKIKVLSDAGDYYVAVKNVYGIDGKDVDACADAIAAADMMATAVGAQILEFIAPIIAKGIEKRARTGSDVPLNIIVCENLHDAPKVLDKLLRKTLGVNFLDYYSRKIGLVGASVGRMVPVVTTQLLEEDPLLVAVEPFCTLPVDAKAFKGEIPRISNLLPVDNIDYYSDMKLYIHNMLHAMCAYLGYLERYTYIYEAAEDIRIRKTLDGALEEIATALAMKHDTNRSEARNYGLELIGRFKNRSLADSILRVGRDTPRKLAHSDRLVGAARLCAEQNLPFENIALGIATAYLFDGDDSSAKVCRYAYSNGILKALQSHSSLEPTDSISTVVAFKYEKIERGR